MAFMNMKQFFILANLFIAFTLLVCVTGEATEAAGGNKNGAAKPLQTLLNSHPEQNFKVPVLVLRQSSSGQTDYAWQWVEWPAFEQYRPQIESMIGNFRPYTSQWSSMMERVPGFAEFATQANNMGSQMSGAMNPNAFVGQLQNLGR